MDKSQAHFLKPLYPQWPPPESQAWPHVLTVDRGAGKLEATTFVTHGIALSSLRSRICCDAVYCEMQSFKAVLGHATGTATGMYSPRLVDTTLATQEMQESLTSGQREKWQELDKELEKFRAEAALRRPPRKPKPTPKSKESPRQSPRQFEEVPSLRDQVSEPSGAEGTQSSPSLDVRSGKRTKTLRAQKRVARTTQASHVQFEPKTAESKAEEDKAKTTLVTAAAAGDTKLDVASTDGFQVGEKVIIDPGSDREESNEIETFGSIILKNPLQFDHDAGVTVRKVATIEGDSQAATTEDADDWTFSGLLFGAAAPEPNSSAEAKPADGSATTFSGLLFGASTPEESTAPEAVQGAEGAPAPQEESTTEPAIQSSATGEATDTSALESAEPIADQQSPRPARRGKTLRAQRRIHRGAHHAPVPFQPKSAAAKAEEDATSNNDAWTFSSLLFGTTENTTDASQGTADAEQNDIGTSGSTAPAASVAASEAANVAADTSTKPTSTVGVVASAAGAVASGVTSSATSAAGAVTSTAGAAASTAKTNVVSAAGAVTSVAGAAASGVTSSTKSAAGAATSVAGAAASGAKTNVVSAAGAVTSVAGAAASGVTSSTKSAAGAATSVASAAASGAKTNVANAASSAANAIGRVRLFGRSPVIEQPEEASAENEPAEEAQEEGQSDADVQERPPPAESPKHVAAFV